MIYSCKKLGYSFEQAKVIYNQSDRFKNSF